MNCAWILHGLEHWFMFFQLLFHSVMRLFYYYIWFCVSVRHLCFWLFARAKSFPISNWRKRPISPFCVHYSHNYHQHFLFVPLFDSVTGGSISCCIWPGKIYIYVTKTTDFVENMIWRFLLLIFFFCYCFFFLKMRFSSRWGLASFSVCCGVSSVINCIIGQFRFPTEVC